jgi:hypothetical protein
LAIREYIESDMLFQFDIDKVFLPEKEQFVIFRQHVKSCDFIWLKETKTADNLFFIEAKNTAPFQQDTLETYLQKIHDKFCHSLLLYIAALFDRHRMKLEGIPGPMKHKDNLKKKIILVLVVRQHKKEWIQVLQEALRKKTKSLKHAFSIQDVLVFNEEGAIQHDLLSDKDEHR